MTLLHFLLGGYGIMAVYSFTWDGFPLALLYLVFASGLMFIVMPLTVCPHCAYYRMADSLCASGLNALSKRIAREGDQDRFADRSSGLLCHNDFYMAAPFAPLVLMLPALLLNFSFLLLGTFVAVMGLLLFRFLVIFPRIACVHCSAKGECPDKKAMGFGDQ